MQRLLYISTSRGPITQPTLDTILRTSRRNNAPAGISGLLVTGGTRFLQVLEGEPEAVAVTFARISADPRHFAIVRLANQTITSRAFANWQMGHVAGGEGTSVSEITAGIADPSLRAYFEGFAQVHAAA